MGTLSSPSELYHPDILAYTRDVSHFHKEHHAMHVINAYNPICGDKFEIRFDLGETIENVSFYGYGCIVSRASLALLTAMIEGKSVDDMRQVVTDTLAFFTTNSPLPDTRLQAFEVVQHFPGRLQCVLLGWNALQDSEIFPGQNE